MRVNKIISAFATGLIGTAVALTQPDIKADDPAVAPKPPSLVISNLKDELNFEGIKKEQDERLQKLLDLPKERIDEIAIGFNDLSWFYLNRFNSLSPYKTKDIRQELLVSAGQKYEKLFL